MKPLIIIPARYNSSRFPGKMLHEMNGKPLIWWTALQASLTGYATFVATDHDGIAEAVSDLNVGVVRTSSKCRNGTERVAEAYEKLASGNPDILNEYDMVINWQGDNPLMPRMFAELMAQTSTVYAARGVDFDIITPYIYFNQNDSKALLEKRKNDIVGGTTVVTDTSSNALYFSKEVLPHISDINNIFSTPVKYHVGAYCYKPAALFEYALLAQTPLEKEEGLEQLRYVENGMKVKCIPMPYTGKIYNEVNNPADVAEVEETLKNNDIEMA